jgi:hypothetical protein
MAYRSTYFALQKEATKLKYVLWQVRMFPTVAVYSAAWNKSPLGLYLARLGGRIDAKTYLLHRSFARSGCKRWIDALVKPPSQPLGADSLLSEFEA